MRSGGLKVRELAGEILNDWDAVVAFVFDPSLPPTNNDAERALRHAVMGLSLCTSCSSIWKHWKRVYGFVATRATLSGDHRADGLGIQIA